MLTRYQRNRLLLLTAMAVSCTLFWLSGRTFGIPEHVGYEDSLALQPSALLDMLVTGVTLLVCTALSTAIVGTVRFEAGLFAGAVGLTALSVRGGPVRYVLQEAGAPRIFLAMALELVVLYGFLGLAWLGLWRLHRAGRLAGDETHDGLKDREHPLNDRLYALGTQVGAMLLLMLFFTRTDEKKQVLWAVFLSSYLATLLAYAMSPVRPSAWYWCGPLVVGAFGYVAAYLKWRGMDDAVHWRAGIGEGFWAPLGRPLPLDYASLGTAGALLGYWMSRRWQSAREAEVAAMAQASRSTNTFRA
ncbi:MAG TPA: hypothetical protein VFB66_21715 [Tepidisphaeraceae bacterium]|nr:hypothetical protein [Tepidisphaeraceae bacterium]